MSSSTLFDHSTLTLTPTPNFNQVCHHEFVVEFVGIVPEMLAVVMRFMPNGSLQSLLYASATPAGATKVTPISNTRYNHPVLFLAPLTHQIHRHAVITNNSFSTFLPPLFNFTAPRLKSCRCR